MSSAAADRRLFKAALAYATLGWPVFPLVPRGKEPLVPRAEGGRGFKDATTDRGRIEEWWTRWPAANIGNRPGEDELALDVDPRGGGDESFDALVVRLGPLPASVTTTTGGGGRHLRFRVPRGLALPKGLAPGLDLKGHDGYLVVPPSVHPTGTAYHFAAFCNPREQVVAELPAAWLEEIRRRGDARAPGAPLPEKIRAGERNNRLFEGACAMRRKGFSEAAILAALEAENRVRCDPPLTTSELRLVAASAARYAPEQHGAATPARTAGGR